MTTVLFVETGSGFGGSAVCLDTLVRHLDPKVFRPVVAHKGEGLAIERIRRQQVTTIHLRPGLLWWQLVCLIRREHVDIVHANNELYSHCGTILAACLTGRSCVVHMRGIRKLTRLEKILIQFVRQFVIISKIGRRHYAQEGVPKSKSCVIYDGIDLEVYGGQRDAAAMRTQLGLRPGQLVIGMVSRLVLKKGHLDFLRAYAALAKEFPQLHALIVGGDPQPNASFLTQLKHFVSAAGLRSRVTFLGWRDDVPQLTSALDIAVQASHYLEGFGTSIMEAMALGKPVVATAVGGVPELVQHQQTGLLYPAGNLAVLEAALRQLITHEEDRSRFGKAGQEVIRYVFDQRMCSQQMEDLYNVMLNAGKPA